MQKISFITRLQDIPADKWDSLVGEKYPFTRRAFLSSLEESGCVGGNSGWMPNFITVDWETDQATVIPAYIKNHSYGEYVFDWSWADAYQRYGLAYYPKLLVGIPFTPVTGPRVLGHTPDNIVDVLAKVCDEQQLSGWHLNFPNADTLTKVISTSNDQVHTRQACQFHWFNRDYLSFDHYLTHFLSRKRKNVLKERKSIAQQDIDITRLTGPEISELDITVFYQCYLNTYQKRHSSPYLNLEFFQMLRQRMSEQILLVLAKKDGNTVACALYFFDDKHLYGRYWGCLEEVQNLHFEVCYYQGIEFCIEQGLQHFDPGTQGEHKISRGFEPTLTHSIHWLAQPEFHQAVGDFVEQEKLHIAAYQKDAKQLLPFHRDTDK
ncbi:MAG: GNAT family N-acetyltransferase [Oleibacter sp.]|nr:GNAT family N-acetyltransferase [Thalassolituus sp.]